MRAVELLAPARDAETAIQAILHGADAVYMGPPSHGARKAASNSLDDIKRVVDFAHPFRAKVYATVNTLVYEKELLAVERLIADLYRVGVDALIVQDMGILEMDIPPIQLHASTQCDIRTPEKARFLQDAGFSQLVLARELTLGEIRKICESVEVPVEVFVHGALCVCYSGRCQMSYSANGRSANRGECAQMCRQRYDLMDGDGNVLMKDRHLLSLRDLDASASLPELLKAGVSSFKIEGRLKDQTYVKNVTAHYRRLIDKEIALAPELYRRSSFGESKTSFIPDTNKAFNRGKTDYFLTERRPSSIANLRTAKSLGEPLKDLKDVSNGDGISYFNTKGEYVGFKVNGIRDGYIFTAPDNVRIPLSELPKDLYRTYDSKFEKVLSRPTATRTMAVDITLDPHGLSLRCENGCEVRLPLEFDIQEARTPQDYSPLLSKLGGTNYNAGRITTHLEPTDFIAASYLTSLRRAAIVALNRAATATYPFQYHRPSVATEYPSKSLDSRDNVCNSYAKKFYTEHGVKEIVEAVETERPEAMEAGQRVMTCRYCLLRELGKCLKDNKKGRPRLPLTIRTGNRTFQLDFDCSKCEMSVLTTK